MYFNSKELDESFFNPAKEIERDDLLKCQMNFFYRLIEAKLNHSHHSRLSRTVNDDKIDIDDTENCSFEDLVSDDEVSLHDPIDDPTENLEGRMYAP